MTLRWLFLVTLAITIGCDVIGEDVAVTPGHHAIVTAQGGHIGNSSDDVHGGGHNETGLHGNGSDHGGGHRVGVHVVSWNFLYVAGPLVLCLFVLAVGILKLLFHYAECLTTVIPESCVLIIFGICVGAILEFGIPETTKMTVISIDDFTLEPRMFMLFLLPPIVLDSAYSLNDPTFADNIGTILLYAVIGTVLNCFMIGPLLYGFAYSGVLGDINISLTQCLLFSSFIVAVDPVAVLAIFKEVGVNNVLYFLVFGESLLNDAVTVVLYNMMKAFNEMSVIPIGEILLGLASFFTVSLGGLAIGILFGVLTALLTRTTSIVRIVEPLVILVMAYLSYLSAELFHWSGIIGMIGCGITQAHYAFHNISERSLTTVNYFVKMLSSLSDAIIFLFLGLEVMRTRHVWHTGFVLCALILCLVCRLITVFGLTWICNTRRVKIISLEEQFIMWYGGLRGAVCFALAATLDDSFVHKNLFLTTTLLIVFFTVFVQGITIKPLVSLLEITRKHGDESHSLAVEFQTNVSVHVTAGVEVIIGNQGSNDLKDWMNKLNEYHLRHWFQTNPKTREEQFLEMYQKIAIKDHVNHIYEATSEVVKVGEYVDEEDEMPMLPMEDPADAAAKKKAAPVGKMGIDDLVSIMGKSYNQNFSKGFDRELGGNSNDIVAKLRLKHARLKENKKLRTPQSTPQNSLRRRHRSNRLDSMGSDASTIHELDLTLAPHDKSLSHHDHHHHTNHQPNGITSSPRHSVSPPHGDAASRRSSGLSEAHPEVRVHTHAQDHPATARGELPLEELGASGVGATNSAFVDDAEGQHKTVIAITAETDPFSTVVGVDGVSNTKC